MGISDYINEKKKYGQIKKKEYIELLRPVVNVFIGDFVNQEKEFLMQFLNERIGNSNKVNCCQLTLGAKKDSTDDEIYNLQISDVDAVTEYSIKMWNTLQKQIENSEELNQSIKDFVIFIFNRVSTTAYTSRGRIRLNFIVQADWPGMSVLPTIVQTMKGQFSEYFANGVDLDIYCILDQKGYKSENFGEERKAFSYLTLNSLENIYENHIANMIYTLSNYTSLDCLEPDSMGDIMQTAALAMLVKDGVSVKDSSNDKDTYYDTSFKEEATAYKGSFYSLGKLKLEVDQDTIEYVVYKTILDDLYQSIENTDSMKSILTQMEIEKEDLEHFFGQQIKYGIFSSRTFYSLVKAKCTNIAGFLNDSAQDLLQAVYGRELEYFWKINVSISRDKQKELIDEKVRKINTALRDAYVNSQCSLAEVYSIITTVEKTFLQYTKDYYDKYLASEQELKSWLENKVDAPNLQTNVKETGEPRVIYYLAEQYLNKLLHVEEAKNMYEVVSECNKEIQESAKYYKGQSDTVKEAANELDQQIRELGTEDEELIRGNIRNYYTQIVNRIIESSISYRDFKRKLNSKICTKEVIGDAIYNEVINYCDTQILNNEEFTHDISEEMIRRLKNYDRFTSEEAIYDLAFETIMKRRKYYVNHVEFGGIYDAICFLVNPNNKFVKSTNKRMKTLLAQHQLKLFFEDHYNGMDILFMEGCFTKESIHYYRLYQKAYEMLESS